MINSIKKKPNEFHTTIKITELKSDVNLCESGTDSFLLFLTNNDIILI